MGYMTTVTFLNDAWHRIKEYPEEFIENIEQGMDGVIGNEISDFGIANRCNGIEVAKSHHADEPRLYFVHRNCMNSLGSSDKFDIKVRKQRLRMAKELIKLETQKIKELESNE